MKPILFNTEMVRAILDGRKTVTRRIIKNAPEHAHMLIDIEPEARNAVFMCGKVDSNTCYDWEDKIKMPFMEGDILYVRETWCKGKITGEEERYYYKADCDLKYHCIWSPSIHMPKEAARIFLRVTDVRVERLQDISKEQILKEGIRATAANVLDLGNDYITEGIDRGIFQTLWNSTVKKSDLDKYGWNANPWVYVIEFEKISREEALK